LNKSEFVEFANQSITPKSGLRYITADDVRNWKNKGLFKHAPEYYRGDFQIVLALLQLEREVQSRSSTKPQHIQPVQTDVSWARDLEETFRKGITQVVTCVASSFNEEQRIIQALKDTGLISSAGHVAVNFYPFSSQPIKIPSTGVEVNEGNMLVFEADGSKGNNPNPVVTPIGRRCFTEDDTFFKNICNSDAVWGHELLPGIEHLVPPEIAEQMRNAALQKRKQFVKPVYTFPVFVPIMKISGMPATMVDSVYITPGGQRIPPLPTVMSLISPRLYQAFLNTNGNSVQEIVNFVSDYNILLRFKFPTDDPQGDFHIEQQRMRKVLVNANEGSLSFKEIRQLSPFHEESLVEADFIKALCLVHDYADYISEIQRAFGPQEQTSRFIPVRRYYSWFDYMWTEILEDITGGLIPLLCRGRGKVLTLPLEDKRGRRREYCIDCEPSRGKEAGESGHQSQGSSSYQIAVSPGMPHF
jgi:hypothetical protein